MALKFLGKGAPLSQKGFDEVARQVEADAFALWSLITVETKGFGFLPDRRLKLLYERHIFHKRTGGRFSEEHREISSRTPGGYTGGGGEYDRLDKAMALDRAAAIESVSWGLGQIMGFNATMLGYTSADEMVSYFAEGEDAQLDGVRRFLLNDAALARAFRTKAWDKVALHYNGADYAKNSYDKKLAEYYHVYQTEGVPSLEIRGAQARLTYLGFNPKGVDGVFGKGTRAAVIAFQQKKGLNASGELDSSTLEALASEAGV